MLAFTRAVEPHQGAFFGGVLFNQPGRGHSARRGRCGRAGLGAIGLVLPPPSDREESIKEFVTRHLGAEAFERLIDPFVSGVYAGDPQKLAMRAALKKVRVHSPAGDGPGPRDAMVVSLIAAEMGARLHPADLLGQCLGSAWVPGCPGVRAGLTRRRVEAAASKRNLKSPMIQPAG